MHMQRSLSIAILLFLLVNKFQNIIFNKTSKYLHAPTSNLVALDGVTVIPQLLNYKFHPQLELILGKNVAKKRVAITHVYLYSINS